MGLPALVYVVTVSAPGEEIGEFYREEVYVSEAVGLTVAGECMEARGGRDSFVEVHDSKPRSWIARQWSNSRCSVWLERLEVVQ